MTASRRRRSALRAACCRARQADRRRHQGHPSGRPTPPLRPSRDRGLHLGGRFADLGLDQRSAARQGARLAAPIASQIDDIVVSTSHRASVAGDDVRLVGSAKGHHDGSRCLPVWKFAASGATVRGSAARQRGGPWRRLQPGSTAAMNGCGRQPALVEGMANCRRRHRLCLRTRAGMVVAAEWWLPAFTKALRRARRKAGRSASAEEQSGRCARSFALH